MPFDFEKSKHFNNAVTDDFFSCFVGRRIGQGVYRDVYEFVFDYDYVVKVETDEQSFANIKEWLIWNHVKYDERLKPWFAPCKIISPRGQFLVQKRTEPLTPEYKLPEKIPAIFADLHLGNWGVLNKKVVCHDYANNRGLNIATKASMVKPKWRT